jgi:IclR family acetate operon transcriptional repressor
MAANIDRGFAMDEQENELRVRCVAVPSSQPGGFRLAVSMSVPITRVTDTLVTRAVPLLTRAAKTISEEIGRDAP